MATNVLTLLMLLIILTTVKSDFEGNHASFNGGDAQMKFKKQIYLKRTSTTEWKTPTFLGINFSKDEKFLVGMYVTKDIGVNTYAGFRAVKSTDDHYVIDSVTQTYQLDEMNLLVKVDYVSDNVAQIVFYKDCEVVKMYCGTLHEHPDKDEIKELNKYCPNSPEVTCVRKIKQQEEDCNDSEGSFCITLNDMPK